MQKIHQEIIKTISDFLEENSKKTFVKIFSVLPDILSQHKDVVDVGSDHGGHVHDILCGHHKEYVPVATIHKKVSHDCITHKGSIVHTVIHKDKNRG